MKKRINACQQEERTKEIHKITKEQMNKESKEGMEDVMNAIMKTSRNTDRIIQSETDIAK